MIPAPSSYEPYPEIAMPVASIWPLLALLGLVVPALVAPADELSQ